MGKLIFVLGGARSGKSGYAVKRAKKLSRRVAFVATASHCDEEMKKRIKLHRASRPKHWKIIEEGENIERILPKLDDNCEVVIIDCIGLWISNLLAGNLNDREIEKRVWALTGAIQKAKPAAILVSNEVGMGIVPDNPLARRFRDLAGLANQTLAAKAGEVIFMHSGIPLRIKGA